MDEIWDEIFKDPQEDQQHAEEILKRLEAREREKNNQSFTEALGNRVWRTKNGQYIDMDKMDDQHLLNSYHLLERNLLSFFNAPKNGYSQVQITQMMQDMLKTGKTGITGIDVALGEQTKGYKFLYEEIMKRNLFAKQLESTAQQAFDVFDDIINSKPDEENAQ